jgi:FlaA1/EpsC-like NDP-sugar epimerase
MAVSKATHLLVMLVSAVFLSCEAFLSLPILSSTVFVSQSRYSLGHNARLRGISLQSTGRRAGSFLSTRMVTEDQRRVHAFGRDSTVLVAGASRGLGLEFVRQLLAKGSYVLATYRGEQPPQVLSDLMASSSGRLQLIKCDVASSESIRAAAESMKGR